MNAERVTAEGINYKTYDAQCYLSRKHNTK